MAFNPTAVPGMTGNLQFSGNLQFGAPAGGFGVPQGGLSGLTGFNDPSGLNRLGGFPQMQGIPGMQGIDPSTALQQAQLGQIQQMQMQMMQMMMLLLLGLMANQVGQGAGQPGAAGQGVSGVDGGSGGGGGSTGSTGATGGGGGTGSTGGASSTGGSEGVTPAGNYNGPINVDRVVNAVPEGHRAAAKKHFPGILAECQRQGVTDKAQIAYILATTVHESGAGAYMEEFASGAAYQGRRDLGNTQAGDGVRYKGRGYVQITGRNNYTNWSKKLGIDLVGNPKLAENPATAARILVQGMKEGSFTGKKLSDYIGGGRQDFTNARRIVNGTDKASTFAATAQRILAAM